MSHIDVSEIGEMIRKIRKEKGLRLEDLADENISPATISNIERGVPHVSTVKAQYLMDKLEIDLSKLPDLIMSEQKEHQNLKFKLLNIESMCGTGFPEKALQELNNINLDDNHPFSCTVHYLKGKFYLEKQIWKRAERSFYKAIQLASLGNRTNNIEAGSFLELGLCCYFQNNLDEALRFTESGLDAYVENGNRLHLKYVLLQNKAIYLERLGRINESMNIVQEVWPELHKIDEAKLLLNFHWLRSDLLRQMKRYDEAIDIAIVGLDIARRNQNYSFLFDLWTVLGTVYMNKSAWDKAKESFERALDLKSLIQEKDKFTTTYARLAILYMHLNQWDQAFDCSQKAIENGKRYHDAPRQTYALQVRGDLHRLKGEKEKAIPYYKQALELARKYHYREKQYKTLLRLSDYWSELNDDEFKDFSVWLGLSV